MSELQQLGLAIADLALALVALLHALLNAAVSLWMPLTFIVLCLWGIRWEDVKAQMQRGAWVGAVLLLFLIGLVWGLCSTPHWEIEGMVIPSIIEKLTLTALWCILAFGCAKLQELYHLAPPELEIAGPPEGDDQGHGHGGHGGHGGHDIGHAHDGHDNHAHAGHH